MADPQQSGFDVNAARQAGYSDDEILAHLTQTRNFDVNAAVQSGYSKSDIIGYLSTSRPVSTQPRGPALPVPAELQPGMVLTHQGPMKFSDAIKSQAPGVPEEAMGWGRSIGQTLRDSAQAPAMGMATLAPIMTGGASLPVQALVTAASGAADTKLMGGSNKAAAISAGVGGALPFLGPLANKAASRLLPSFLKSSAGAAFDTASQAAGSSAVDTEGAGQAALGAQQLQEAGRTMPRTMTRFLQRVTSPNAPPLSYEEARNFYSAAGELSANENAALTPKMRMQLNMFKSELGKAIQQTADNAGVGSEYGQAMSDYAKAKRLEDTWDTVWSAAQKHIVPGMLHAVGAGAVAGAGYGIYKEFAK